MQRAMPPVPARTLPPVRQPASRLALWCRRERSSLVLALLLGTLLLTVVVWSLATEGFKVQVETLDTHVSVH